MQNITFFSGVPFDRQQRQIAFFKTETERNRFLSKYIITGVTNIKRFNFPFSVMSLTGEKEVETINFVEVEETEITDPKPRLYFYFVTSIEKTGSETYNLYLEIDNINTYLFLSESGNIELPTISKCSIISDSVIKPGFSYSSKVEPTANRLKENPVVSLTVSYFNGTDPLYLFVALLKVPEIKYFYAVGTKYEIAGLPEILSKSYLQKVENNTIVQGDKVEPVKYYVFPYVGKIPFFISETSLDFYFNPYIYYPNDKTASLNYGDNVTKNRFIMGMIDNQHEIKNEEEINFISYKVGSVFSVGSLFNREPITADGKNHVLNFSLNFIFGELSFFCKYDSKIIDLLQDFETPVYNDEFLTYMSQNQNQMRISNLSRALNVFQNATFAVGGVGVGVASANPLMIANAVSNGAVGIVGSIHECAMNTAKLKDLEKMPDRVDSLFTSGFTVAFNSFIGVWESEPVNFDYITEFGEENGYSCFIPCVPDFANSNGKDFRFLQTAGAQFVGKFPFSVSESLSQVFNNGVRIFYNPEKMLER